MGQVPLFLNAETTVLGLIDACLTCMYSLIKSSLHISEPVSSMIQSHRSNHARCNGPNTLTSRGYSLWVVWGGRQRTMMLWSSARWRIRNDSWKLWPSRMRRMGFPDLFRAVAWGMKDFLEPFGTNEVISPAIRRCCDAKVNSGSAQEVENCKWIRTQYQDGSQTIQGRMMSQETRSQV